ncbi:Uncharacterized protein TCM_003712 [Theobroma cacao]|uniref:Putative plant transposon protein domain-containing protein n=1 Tax=Theobroma cacao TaxID=3641 RepID=A0A061DP89_THECC|nr:Uncharacterized protein TCM_003712 [Theobroma cacao]
MAPKKKVRGVPLSFKASAMKDEYKLWYHFLVAQLLLVKHLNDVTRDKAILLHAIIFRMSINVGQVMFNNIVQAAHSPHDALWYPSLITALCKKMGVIRDKMKKSCIPKFFWM